MKTILSFICGLGLSWDFLSQWIKRNNSSTTLATFLCFDFGQNSLWRGGMTETRYNFARILVWDRQKSLPTLDVRVENLHDNYYDLLRIQGKNLKKN